MAFDRRGRSRRGQIDVLRQRKQMRAGGIMWFVPETRQKDIDPVTSLDTAPASRTAHAR